MAVNNPLHKENKSNAIMFSSKRLVINIIRRFFILCILFIGLGKSFVFACGCEEKIINYKKAFNNQSSVLNKQEFRYKESGKWKEAKPVVVIKPQVI